MAHVELPQEELQPLLQSIQEAFEPLTKAMPLIMKIPEEIKRVADNISEDLGSGVPEKIDSAVEKITQDEAEDLLKKELSEAEQEALQKLTEEVQLLRENGIPAEIKEGKVTRLTEEQIKETQKQYIQSIENEKVIQRQIEETKKSNLSDDELIKTMKTLNEKLEKNNKSREKHEDKLAGRLPEMTRGRDGESRGPRVFTEMKDAGAEVFGAPIAALTELKNSFTENFGALINMNRKHYDKMEDYGKTGERADNISIAKFLALTLIATAILAKITDYFGGGGAEPRGKIRRDKREEMFGPTEERTGSVGLIDIEGGTDNRTRGRVEGKKFEIIDDKKNILPQADDVGLNDQDDKFLKNRLASRDRKELIAMKDINKDEKSNTNIFQTQNNNQNNTNEFTGGNMVAAKDNPYAVIG